MRNATIRRTTAETDITLSLALDGTGMTDINTGCGFLDHMLTLFARHSRFDLSVTCKGDVEVDDHHTVEDVGICLGQAVAEALKEKRGINRYGSILLPMDEALIAAAVDLSGRAYLGFDLAIPTEKVGNFDTELVKEFFLAFTRQAACTLHLKQMAGENSHHIIEGAFKAFGRILRQAAAIDPDTADEIPSTKGVL
ncbi:MAG: imidazoleglycerol-phosphate dehydratase HisB [Clostridia bacterium]|nr:imidazoleglycerol-phosphate dehydratase HisB [Clostridia bacterium]